MYDLLDSCHYTSELTIPHAENVGMPDISVFGVTMRAPNEIPRAVEDSAAHKHREELRNRMSNLLQQARVLQTQTLDADTRRATLIRDIEDYVADHIAFSEKHGFWRSER